MVSPQKFEVYLVDFDPAIGSEIKKIRPCVIISPNIANKKMNTIVVMPMTMQIKNYPFRHKISFKGKQGQIAIDQIKAIDKSRIIKKLGKLDKQDAEKLLENIHMFIEA